MELSGEPTILMSQYGAYGPAQIYSRDDIVDIVKYANLKGDPSLIQREHFACMSDIWFSVLYSPNLPYKRLPIKDSNGIESQLVPF